MFRSKVLFILIASLVFTSIDVSAKPKKRKPPRVYSSWEIGGNYLMWNEPMTTIRGGTTSRGMANYAGFGVGIEKHWRHKRMLYAGILNYAAGKASAGKFAAAAAYTDGVNRAWWAAHLTLSANYALHKDFYLGTGILARYRDADWKTTDTSLTVKPVSNSHFTGLLILRWEVARSVQLTQVYAPLDMKGASLWQWILMLRL